MNFFPINDYVVFVSAPLTHLVMFPFYLQAKDVGDLNSWKSLVSMQLETLLKDNSVLRSLSYFNNISLTYVML